MLLTKGADIPIGSPLTCMCLTSAAWAAISWVGVIFCSLGTKPATRELLGMVRGPADFRPVALPAVRDLETFAFTSSPTPINLLTMIALRTRFMNLARAADTSTTGSGVDGSVIGDAGKASDGRPLASPELRSSSRPSWKGTTDLVGVMRSDLGAMITALGGMVGLVYGGGMDRMLSAPPMLPEDRPNIALIRLRGIDARRTTRALQLKAVFDFSGAVFFIHPYPVASSTLSETSSSISASHFFPLCRLKTIRSEANQADTAIRPKELKAEKTVVIVEVTKC